MFDRRLLRLDLAACVLLVTGLLVATCIFGHDPSTVHSPNIPAHVFGPLGEAVGKILTDALGVAVYVLLANWFVVVVMLFLRRRWVVWSIRLFGWLLLVPCAAVVAERPAATHSEPSTG